MSRRTQAFCETKLPCSRTQQMGHAVHTLSRGHILPQIPKDKRYEAKLQITAWQRDKTKQHGGHVEIRDSWPTVTLPLPSCGIHEKSALKMTCLVRQSVMQMPPSAEILFITFHAHNLQAFRSTWKGQHFKAQWSLYVPPVYHSPILHSAHTVFVCFVWIWEQTTIISLYSINWLVCITERECVYCAVRTGSLYIIQVILCV